MKKLFGKMRGGHPSPPRPPIDEVLYSLLGGALGIALLGGLSKMTGNALLMAPFGATCVLLFAVPESPLAQPRSVVGGHLLATVIGIFFLTVMGNDWPSIGLAVGTAIAGMQLTRTVHPPAGATPIVAIMGGAKWHFLFSPVLAGCALLLVLALFFNNLAKTRHYPRFWF